MLSLGDFARLRLAARRLRRLALTFARLLFVGATLAACAAEEPSGAPTGTRVLLAAEPPRLHVGEVGELEVVVITPPDHGVRPLEPPKDVAGLWILDAERLPVEREPARWIHRTRLRVRPHQLGTLRWPAGQVEIEAPDGSVEARAWEPLELEVLSVRPEHPDRLTAYGVRPAPPEPPRVGALAAAAVGAALALSGVALVGWARRRRPQAADSAAAHREPPWVEARRELTRAHSALARQPREAAHGAARLLRRYAAARFGADCVARTAEELASAQGPFSLTTRWPGFVALVGELDDLRFRPECAEAARPALRARVESLLEAAERFVAETTPESGA